MNNLKATRYDHRLVNSKNSDLKSKACLKKSYYKLLNFQQYIVFYNVSVSGHRKDGTLIMFILDSTSKLCTKYCSCSILLSSPFVYSSFTERAWVLKIFILKPYEPCTMIWNNFLFHYFVAPLYYRKDQEPYILLFLKSTNINLA
jgi:hypothetical protein